MTSTDLPRPEPVTKAGAIAGAVAALIITAGGLARMLGLLTDDVDVAAIADQVSNLILGVGILWTTLAPVALAWHARSKVTPLDDPRDSAGNSLVVEGELAGPVVDQLVVDQAEPDPPTVPLPAQAAEPAVATASALHDELAAMVAALRTDEPTGTVRTPADPAGPLPVELEAQQAAAGTTAVLPIATAALPVIPSPARSTDTMPAMPAVSV